MMRFYRGCILSGINPTIGNYNADYYYRYLFDNVAISLARTRALYETIDGALSHLGNASSVNTYVVMKYSASCRNFKDWAMQRKDIMPYAVNFYKYNVNNGYTLICTKITGTEYV